MSNKIQISLLLAIGLVISSVSYANEPTRLISDKELALKALNDMSGYLRTLDRLSIHANLYVDEILDSGQKIQKNRSILITANPPSNLKAITSNTDNVREFYYDGKEFTIYTPQTGYYASFKAPETIPKLIEKATDNYGCSSFASMKFITPNCYFLKNHNFLSLTSSCKMSSNS